MEQQIFRTIFGEYIDADHPLSDCLVDALRLDVRGRGLYVEVQAPILMDSWVFEDVEQKLRMALSLQTATVVPHFPASAVRTSGKSGCQRQHVPQEPVHADALPAHHPQAQGEVSAPRRLQYRQCCAYGGRCCGHGAVFP